MKYGSVSLTLAAMLAIGHPSAAASLQEVTGFGNNPSNAKMYLYVPDRPAASPPVLVAIHYCGGSANAYFTGTGYRSLADQHGFIVVYPQTTSSDGCFDVHSDATLKHDGGGDSASIVSMVRYTISKYAANASRVYVTGTSSGAMMTNVLLGAYPDVFRGGAAFAGVPYGCFAGQSAWNSACAQGQTTKTGQQWGDLVRSAYPGYTGPRPRVQLWHGSNDETLNFHNFGEAIKEWTNVLGVSETPTTTEQNTPQSNWTRTRYKDSSGVVSVEGIVETGMTHNLTVLAGDVVRFFGLDGTADPGGSSGGAAGSTGAGGGGANSGGANSGGASNGGAAPSSGGATAAGVAGTGTTAAGGTSARVASGGATGFVPPATGGRMVGSGAAGTTANGGTDGTGGASGAPAGPAGAGAPSAGAESATSDEPSSCSIRRASAHTHGTVAALAAVIITSFVRRKRQKGGKAAS
jgi:acetylxylan esterase